MSDRSKIDIDRDRVTVLLLINSLLIKKAYNIYVTILSNQQTTKRMLHQSRQSILDQYNNLNRRLQCNLSVLSYINDLYHNKAAAQQPNRLQFPVILTAPAEIPELKLLYKRLHDLYPEAIQYLKLKLMQIKQLQLQQLPQKQPDDFQRRQLQQSQQQTKQFQLPQQPMSMPQLQQQGSQQHLPQRQQQAFSQYNMAQGQPNQQFNSTQMNMAQQRNLNTAQLNAQLTQLQLKNVPSDSISKNTSAPGIFNPDDGGFANFQDTGAATARSGAPPMLISPQQILLQQGAGNNEYNLGFF